MEECVVGARRCGAVGDGVGAVANAATGQAEDPAEDPADDPADDPAEDPAAGRASVVAGGRVRGCGRHAVSSRRPARRAPPRPGRGQHHQRVDVEFGEGVAQFQGHALHPQHDVDQRVDIAGAPPDPSRRARPRSSASMPRASPAKGGTRTAVSAAPRRALRRSRRSRSARRAGRGDADDHLDAALDHLADQDAVQVDALVAGDVGQLAIGVPDLAGGGQADLDQAEFGLVGELAAEAFITTG